MLPADSISNFMCGVNEISTENCTKSINFDDLDINDVLENIRILLNYIKKQRGLQSRARTGGWGKHAWVWGLSPRQKICTCISSKNLRLVFCISHSEFPARRILSTRRFAPHAKVPILRALSNSGLRGWDSNAQLTPYTYPPVSKRGGLYHHRFSVLWYLVSTALRLHKRFPRYCPASLFFRGEGSTVIPKFSIRLPTKSCLLTGSHSTIELPRNM